MNPKKPKELFLKDYAACQSVAEQELVYKSSKDAIKSGWQIVLEPLIERCLGLDRWTRIQHPGFWEKTRGHALTPVSEAESSRIFLAETLDDHLGKPKSERIRVVGPPRTCRPLNTGGEVCEWIPRASSLEHRMSFTYDRKGVAVSWSYQGAHGQFTNVDYRTVELRPAASLPAQSRQDAHWVHPKKPNELLHEDYGECQLKAQQAQQDPKNTAARSGAYLLMDQDIERCVKEKGWRKIETR